METEAFVHPRESALLTEGPHDGGRLQGINLQ